MPVELVLGCVCAPNVPDGKLPCTQPYRMSTLDDLTAMHALDTQGMQSAGAMECI